VVVSVVGGVVLVLVLLMLLLLPCEHRYRKTAADVVAEESERLGRVPEGLRYRAGAHRGRAGGRKPASVRDAVRVAAAEKDRRALRVKAGNQQKGRERRKLQDAVREARE
jgi:hypothetical protein